MIACFGVLFRDKHSTIIDNRPKKIDEIHVLAILFCIFLTVKYAPIYQITVFGVFASVLKSRGFKKSLNLFVTYGKIGNSADGILTGGNFMVFNPTGRVPGVSF